MIDYGQKKMIIRISSFFSSTIDVFWLLVQKLIGGLVISVFENSNNIAKFFSILLAIPWQFQNFYNAVITVGTPQGLTGPLRWIVWVWYTLIWTYALFFVGSVGTFQEVDDLIPKHPGSRADRMDIQQDQLTEGDTAQI
jgi:hypothetical protein